MNIRTTEYPFFFLKGGLGVQNKFSFNKTPKSIKEMAHGEEVKCSHVKFKSLSTIFLDRRSKHFLTHTWTSVVFVYCGFFCKHLDHLSQLLLK